MHVDAPRDRPVAAPAALGSLLHHALIYGSDSEFLDGALPTLHCGIERGEPTLAITTPQRAALLRDALGPDAHAVSFADSAAWFRVPGWAYGEYHRFIRQNRRPDGRLWILAEPGWHGWNPDQQTEWQRCESVLNVAYGWAPAAIVCAYSRTDLSAPTLAEAERSHPALVSGRHAKGSGHYVPPAQYLAAHQLELAPAPTTAFALLFDLGDLSAVRAVAGSWAQREGLSVDQVRDLLIAVHEIASNAVEHGGGSGLLRLWGTDRDLSCQVSSAAPLRQPFPGYLPPDTGQERGRGLWMARQICSRVDVIPRPEGGVDVRIIMPRVAGPGADGTDAA